MFKSTQPDTDFLYKSFQDVLNSSLKINLDNPTSSSVNEQTPINLTKKPVSKEEEEIYKWTNIEPEPKSPFNDNKRSPITDDILYFINTHSKSFSGWKPEYIFKKGNVDVKQFSYLAEQRNYDIFGFNIGISLYAEKDTGKHVVIWEDISQIHARPSFLNQKMKPNIKKPFSTKSITKEHKKPPYYTYGNFKFKKCLTKKMTEFIDMYGYEKFIIFNPTYEYKDPEKEIIDENEEIIINISELADYYTREELKLKYGTFKIEEHVDEYDKVHQMHCQKIKLFKRNNNG